MFDFSAIGDFEKHINMSIPNYSGLCNIFKAFVYEFAQPEGDVVDLGCSSGSFLNSVYGAKSVRYIGVDSVNFDSQKSFKFVQDDCETFLMNHERADVIVSMFTLQFLGKHKRKRVVEQLRRLVNSGAVLLVSEKMLLDSRVESVLKRGHLQDKRKHFSDTEILDKDLDLFGSMFCLDESDLVKELESIGKVSRVWQSFNFAGFIVSK